MQPSRNAIAIAAGGTGGHIIPAIATARALAKLDAELEVKFLCGRRDVELGIYRKQGIDPLVLPIGRFGRGLSGKLRTAWQIWRARIAAQRFLREFRPFCLLGMGGYVTVPQVWAARRLGIEIVLHEQNSVLGRAHRLTRKWAHVVACSYPETVKALHETPAMLVGNPVDESIIGASREEAREHFGVSGADRVLLVTGGSQGARAINRLIGEGLGFLSAWAAHEGVRLAVLWACGKEDVEGISDDIERWSAGPLMLRPLPFIERMDLGYACADLIVCRAGAMTLAEVAATGTPAVFVPIPGSIYDHQRLNAESAVRRGGGVLLDEREARPEDLARAVTDILSDESRMKEMAAACKRGARMDAGERLARLLLSLRKQQ